MPVVPVYHLTMYSFSHLLCLSSYVYKCGFRVSLCGKPPKIAWILIQISWQYLVNRWAMLCAVLIIGHCYVFQGFGMNIIRTLNFHRDWYMWLNNKEMIYLLLLNDTIVSQTMGHDPKVGNESYFWRVAGIENRPYTFNVFYCFIKIMGCSLRLFAVGLLTFENAEPYCFPKEINTIGNKYYMIQVKNIYYDDLWFSLSEFVNNGNELQYS